MQTISLVPRPSILDRLCCPHDLGSELQGVDVRRMVGAIQRDLEDLLNARQTYQGLQNFPTLRNSMLAFGLPDASQFDLETYTAKKRFLRTIESVIRNFEPRVSDVRVHLLEGEKVEMGKMQFVIEAKLRLAPQPGIQFHSTLELGTGHYQLNRLDD